MVCVFKNTECAHSGIFGHTKQPGDFEERPHKGHQGKYFDLLFQRTIAIAKTTYESCIDYYFRAKVQIIINY